MEEFWNFKVGVKVLAETEGDITPVQMHFH